MMAAKTLNYAVVGLQHGREHVQAVSGLPGGRLLMCCDLAEENFRALRLPPAVLFTDDYQAVLNHPEVEAVVLAVPTHLHESFAVAALQAGKHVLCEKPLALTVAEGERIRAAAENSGRVFQIGYEVRSSSFHEKIMECIREGRIGQVTNVWWNMFTDTVEKGWRTDRKKRGGKIFDCCCHYYDLLQLWAGAPVVRLCAFGNRLGQTGPCREEIPQTAVILFEYANGVRGTFNLSEQSLNRQNSTCGLAGTEGKIEADPYYPHGAGSIVIGEKGGIFQHRIDIGYPGCQEISVGHLGFREQHEAFFNAVCSGGKVGCTVEDGIGLIRILDAIDESLTTGQAVNL